MPTARGRGYCWSDLVLSKLRGQTVISKLLLQASCVPVAGLEGKQPRGGSGTTKSGPQGTEEAWEAWTEETQAPGLCHHRLAFSAVEHWLPVLSWS